MMKPGPKPKPREEHYLYKPMRWPRDLWEELEKATPPRKRSAYVHEALRQALERDRRKRQREQVA